MKTSKQFLLGLFLFSVTSVFCQPDVILSTDYLPGRTLEASIPTTRAQLIATQTYYDDDISELRRQNNSTTIVFNNKMMNAFFNNEINSFATSLKDFSLDTSFSNIDTDSKTLTIGTNINFKNLFNSPDKELRKTNHVLSLSATGSIDKNFSKVYYYSKTLNEYDFASELGINLKYTYMCNGSVTYNLAQKANIVAYRQGVLNTYINGVITNDNIPAGITTNEIEKKYYEYYKKIADKEIDYYKKNNIITAYSLWYFSINSFIPLTEKEINVKTTNTTGSFSTEKFKNWKVDGSVNFFRSSIINKYSLNFRLNGSIYNNNNFIAENTKPLTFQTIINQSPTQQVLAPSDLVFIGDYKTFNTTSLKTELSTLFFNNSIGLSGAVEKNFGEYDAKNWKLGIPVSLKDKDKKPTVNFEIQWKEVNRLHTVGISAGYVFGKFLK